MRLIQLKQVVASLLLLTFSTQVLGRTCEIIAQECIEGRSSKEIQGIMVTRDCWKYQNTMSCFDEDAYDYCEQIARTPGCNRVSQVINDNGSLTYQYKCGKADIIDPQVVLLEESYTVNSTEEMPPECAAPEQNPGCRRAELVCLDASGNRVAKINDPLTDCASWQQNYTCQVANSQNFCAPLASAGCTVLEQNCTLNSPIDDSACISMDVTYSCLGSIANTGPMPDKIVRLDDNYTLSTVPLTKECEDGENDPLCFVAREECVEGAATRMVDGVAVYNDCWRKERTFACLAGTPTSSECKTLEEKPGCRETRSECSDDEYVNGKCKDLTREFRCETGEGTEFSYMDCGDRMLCYKPPVTQRVVKKDAWGNPMKECIPGTDYEECKYVYETITLEDAVNTTEQCFSTAYTPDNDFGRVIATLEAAKGFGYQLFEGKPQKCIVKKVWGAQNCCDPNHAYRNGSTRQAMKQAAVSFAVSFGASVLSAAANAATAYLKSAFTTPPAPITDPVTGVTSYPVESGGPVTSQPLDGIHSSIKSNPLAKYLDDMYQGLTYPGRVVQGAETFGAQGVIKSFQAYVQAAGQVKSAYEVIASEDSSGAARHLGETIQNLALTIAASYIGTVLGTALAIEIGLLKGSTASLCWICVIVMAIIIILTFIFMEWFECDEESAELGANIRYGLCTAVGSYCAQKTLKLCYKKMRSYCCFPSMLSRIVQEQGRPQLGLNFGPTKHPNCRSLTEDEFMRIDFDKIDFSELIRELMNTFQNDTPAKNAGKAEKRAKGIGDTVSDYYNSP